MIGISGALMALVASLLMLQPNLGDAVLFVGTWLVHGDAGGRAAAAHRHAAGRRASPGCCAAYLFYDNARHRIDSFLGGGTAYDQVDLASRTLTGGGWTGSGLWLGARKMRLPEAHTDYIFSVIGEEFGLLVCALIVLLYLAIIAAGADAAGRRGGLFTMLAATGLIALFGGQAFINILVNLQLFPSKGMTLPLVSYGGSSTIALCFTVGLLLAVTRRNPFLDARSAGFDSARRTGEGRTSEMTGAASRHLRAGRRRHRRAPDPGLRAGRMNWNGAATTSR